MDHRKRGSKLSRLAVVTCTGGRPEAFRLCRGYLERQTRRPDEWIVVDDCLPRQEIPFGPIRIYPEPPWHPEGSHTLPRNMLAALKVVREDGKFDVVTIMEDDDWYSPIYIERMEGLLKSKRDQGIRIVGEMNTVFYNVRTRTWRQNWHPDHASLCSVTFHTDILDEIFQIIEDHNAPTLDHAIFRTVDHHKIHLVASNMVLGIKGIPDERVGASRLHKEITGRLVKDDYDLRFLRAFIGDDADLYAKFFEDAKAQTPAREQPIVDYLDTPGAMTAAEAEREKQLARMSPGQKKYLRLREAIKRSRA